MCEARPIESIKSPRGNLCVFPFTHNNVTYDSCAQPDDTNRDISDLAFDRPWCATAVDSGGVMPNGTDNWGVCIDERATTYSFGPSTGGDIEESGRFCSLPFKMGDW